MKFIQIQVWELKHPDTNKPESLWPEKGQRSIIFQSGTILPGDWPEAQDALATIFRAQYLPGEES